MYPILKTGCRNDEETPFLDKFRARVALEVLRGDRTGQVTVAKCKVGAAGYELEVTSN